jgi:hypothetical protein
MMFYSRTMVDISLLLGQDPSPYSEAYERFQAQLQSTTPTTFKSPALARRLSGHR